MKNICALAFFSIILYWNGNRFCILQIKQKELSDIDIQHYDCWYPGNARSQGISSEVVDLVLTYMIRVPHGKGWMVAIIMDLWLIACEQPWHIAMDFRYLQGRLYLQSILVWVRGTGQAACKNISNFLYSVLIRLLRKKTSIPMA